MTQQTISGEQAAADYYDGRTLHFGHFYGVHAVPDGGTPLVVVSGNCQTEALRVLLDGAPSGSVRTVRVPPVFELTADDLPHLARLLARTDVLVSQPVRAGYRGLPLGTDELAALLPAHARVVRVPVVRWAAPYPYQAVVRSPAGDPPVVPYTDLRTVVAVATGRRPRGPMPAEGVRAVAAASLAELQRRERAAGTVVVSDLLVPAGADAAHVVNHPGNTVLVGLARRVQEAIGVPADAEDPGRVLLREVFAPLYPEVVQALDLDADPRPRWVLRGEELDDAAVEGPQEEWLRAHPDVVDLTLERHAATVRAMGWLA